MLPLLSSCLAEAGSPPVVFDEANQLYAQGKFTEAAQKWNELLTNGQRSAAVYFNLGNALFKAGQIGEAIAAYSHAEAIAPRDPDVQANLKFARNRVQGLTLPAPAWKRVFGKLNLNEWTITAAAAVWMWLLLLAVGQWRPLWRTFMANYVLVIGVMAVTFCSCLGFVFYQSGLPLAVAAVSQAVLHQAPLAESESVLTVYDGAELRVLDRKNEWVQVSPGRNRTGWIRQDQVRPLNYFR